MADMERINAQVVLEKIIKEKKAERLDINALREYRNLRSWEETQVSNLNNDIFGLEYALKAIQQ